MIMKISLNLPLSLLLLSTFLLSFPSPSYQQHPHTFSNPRLKKAYIALQAWKKSITDDPNNFTRNWEGYNVCNYNGVFCAPSLDNSYVQTVAGIDLNHANIAGSLPKKLGLLTDLALFHINSNRFCGSFPYTLKNWCLLYELDVSNNYFNGGFPKVLLSLPSLKFIDIRYNYFNGPIPSKLFDLKLDAIFINNNNFTSKFPQNIGNSPVSVVVLANNNFQGCLPNSISKMSKTLNEFILEGAGLKGCLPSGIGKLTQLTVLDVSYNELSGPLPDSIGKMKNLEQLNVAFNSFSGEIPASICRLPKLENFTYSYNFFSHAPYECLKLKSKDDIFNCIPNRPSQRSHSACTSFNAYPISCESFGCYY
ncbi:hypothetical protein SOVF_168590 [Spinacia oleracea]|uniref:Cell wall hydroxyproline-rich glycoprotein n=1 Tax=Spinacia oleracea TaxID=3562 RepID=A0A9R0ITD3_SPIOL|nr:leucine-rich repeat extensin-like protein 6 [Spinacia oleracea]KNA07798.1 hypothetical protein SOVF_168590 [Spinacia oleracea]